MALACRYNARAVSSSPFIARTEPADTSRLHSTCRSLNPSETSFSQVSIACSTGVGPSNAKSARFTPIFVASRSFPAKSRVLHRMLCRFPCKLVLACNPVVEKDQAPGDRQLVVRAPLVPSIGMSPRARQRLVTNAGLVPREDPHQQLDQLACGLDARISDSLCG